MNVLDDQCPATAKIRQIPEARRAGDIVTSAQVGLMLRLWRGAPWSRNPLMGGFHRLEIVAVAVTLTFVLLMIPVAAAIGTVYYANSSERAQSERDTRQRVVAVLLEDSRPADPDGDPRIPRASDYATARWSVDGVEHTGPLQTPAGATAGQEITVWVDADALPTTAPQSGTHAGLDGVALAVTVWFLSAGTAVTVLYVVHRIGLRRRMAQWDREWEAADHRPSR